MRLGAGAGSWGWDGLGRAGDHIPCDVGDSVWRAGLHVSRRFSIIDLPLFRLPFFLHSRTHLDVRQLKGKILARVHDGIRLNNLSMQCYYQLGSYRTDTNCHQTIFNISLPNNITVHVAIRKRTITMILD